jgi:hypothetical protein
MAVWQLKHFMQVYKLRNSQSAISLMLTLLLLRFQQAGLQRRSVLGFNLLEDDTEPTL